MKGVVGEGFFGVLPFSFCLLIVLLLLFWRRKSDHVAFFLQNIEGRQFVVVFLLSTCPGLSVSVFVSWLLTFS